MSEEIRSDYTKIVKRIDYILYRITASECLITGTVIKGTHQTHSQYYSPAYLIFFRWNLHTRATSYNANIS